MHLFTEGVVDKREKTYDHYRDKDYMKKVFKNLKKYVMKIINYEKKETMPLTNKEHDLYVNKKTAKKKICREEYENTDDKNYHRVIDQNHFTGKYSGDSYKYVI